MRNFPQLHLHGQASTSLPPDPGAAASAADPWAAGLLRECAASIATKDSARTHHLLWVLNELASPYGDREQRLASHFLQALFCRATASGDRCLRTLTSAAERGRSFESTRRVMLRFQETNPWATFGHVVSNGAILEAMEGEAKLHIIDISNTYCTQWPTLLESLATRADVDTPHLRLTAVVAGGGGDAVMTEIGRRMEKFARLMGVPFEFNVVSGLPRLSELRQEVLSLREDEALAVNCMGALRRVNVDDRAAFLGMLRSLRPKVVTVVEEEADFSGAGDDFVKCFDECLRFYSLFFEILEESFPATSNERLALERESGRAIVGVLACDGDGSSGGGGGDSERMERATQWCERLVQAFSPKEISDDVMDDAGALLKRYPPGWSLLPATAEVPGVYLSWKEEPVVWASAWKM